MHCVSSLRITASDSFGHTCADWWPTSGNAASSSVILLVMSATANVCHCVYVQQCRSSRVCAAMQHASGSLGRPACHSGRETTSGSAEQPHHWQSNPPDYMESRGWADVTSHYLSASELAEWKNPRLELSGMPGCAERWLASHPLETRKDAGYSAIILEPSSAARPALHDGTETKEKSAASDIVSTLAVDAFEEGMIIAAAIMSQFVHEILLNLPPQCLLTLSAGSHALHRYATCDDVSRGIIYGSLSTDWVAVLDHSI